MAFQIAGGGILLLFYGSYLAKMFRQRTQGIRTDQLGRGKAGAERLTEWGVKAAAWAVLAAEAVSLILNVHGSSVRILGGARGRDFRVSWWKDSQFIYKKYRLISKFAGMLISFSRMETRFPLFLFLFPLCCRRRARPSAGFFCAGGSGQFFLRERRGPFFGRWAAAVLSPHQKRRWPPV